MLELSGVLTQVGVSVSGGKKKKTPHRYLQREEDPLRALSKRGHLINEHVPLFFPSPSVALSRCYNKTNGTFSSGTLPLMHRVAPCQQDGLEMLPLGQVSSQCHGPDGQMHSGDQGADAGYQPDEHSDSSPSQHSCCLVGNNENCPADNTGETHFYSKCPQYFSKYFSLLLSLSLSLSLSPCSTESVDIGESIRFLRILQLIIIQLNHELLECDRKQTRSNVIHTHVSWGL